MGSGQGVAIGCVDFWTGGCFLVISAYGLVGILDVVDCGTCVCYGIVGGYCIIWWDYSLCIR